VFGSADSLPKAQALYADIKGRMIKYDRHPDELKLLPGLSVILAESQQEAEDKYQALQQLIHPDVMRHVLAEDLEIDLADIPLDTPITEDMLPAKGNTHEAYFNHLLGIVRAEKPTVQQLFFRWSTRGRNTFRGTPKQVADLMEEFFVSEAADGFMISFQTMGDSLQEFVKRVVPDLQRRGLFRKEYEGATLREHLGLKRPSNRYTAPSRA
jgi:alkanesulfonate monooxygenase SsuD/methylene tetrahydromethanopterin reductase-like flavin-dependent oxidoreductase (luciferase family)